MYIVTFLTYENSHFLKKTFPINIDVTFVVLFYFLFSFVEKFTLNTVEAVPYLLKFVAYQFSKFNKYLFLNMHKIFFWDFINMSIMYNLKEHLDIYFVWRSAVMLLSWKIFGKQKNNFRSTFCYLNDNQKSLHIIWVA